MKFKSRTLFWDTVLNISRSVEPLGPRKGEEE